MGLGTRVRTQKEIKPETEESQLFNRHREKTWKYCEKRPAAIDGLRLRRIEE